MRLQAATLLLSLTFFTSAWAQNVGLAGVLGEKALLIVDGGTPRAVAIGQTMQGVKVLSIQSNEAVIEVAGKRQTLRLGEAPASIGNGSPGAESGGQRIVLSAGDGGHFFSQGQINGRSVRMLVDTGATASGLGAAEARSIGLNFDGGQRVPMATANGIVGAWRVKLQSVRVGDVVVYDVDALISPGSMGVVLLGNSFLSRFQMTRTNDQMVLEKRY